MDLSGAGGQGRELDGNAVPQALHQTTTPDSASSQHPQGICVHIKAWEALTLHMTRA